MPVFFIEADQVRDGQITITGPLLRHLRASLRARVGEAIWFGTRERRRYLTRVSFLDRRQLVGHVLEQQEEPLRRGPRVALGQAILKGDKMDWLLQKATELGAASIVPLLTGHTIARPATARAATQRERWQRIALEAAQQAERWEVPVVDALLAVQEFLAESPEHWLKLILSERGPGTSLSSVALPSGQDHTLALAVGPEGGWTSSELDEALTHGFIPVTLGSRILRAETAALASLSILQSRLGNLG